MCPSTPVLSPSASKTTCPACAGISPLPRTMNAGPDTILIRPAADGCWPRAGVAAAASMRGRTIIQHRRLDLRAPLITRYALNTVPPPPRSLVGDVPVAGPVTDSAGHDAAPCAAFRCDPWGGTADQLANEVPAAVRAAGPETTVNLCNLGGRMTQRVSSL